MYGYLSLGTLKHSLIGMVDSVDDSFVHYLLGLIEKPAKEDDPYNYIIIRVLVSSVPIHRHVSTNNV